MKKFLFLSVLLTVAISCKVATTTTPSSPGTMENVKDDEITVVAQFKGQQVTGVTHSRDGRTFVNFPRWRKGVENSVVEIKDNGQQVSYPSDRWNSWEIGQPVGADQFVGVQSVIAFENFLYVVDTRSKLFEKVLDAPRVYVFDLENDALVNTYILQDDSYYPDSYTNDLRVDKKNNSLYLTDSGHPGLIVIDLQTGNSKRLLNEHPSTTAQFSSLTIDGKKWENTIHSDGIALDTTNDRLYYHALTGYHLYSIPTDALKLNDSKAIEDQVRFEASTSAPDGMLFDQAGNLYFADLENDKINYRKPDGSIHTLVQGEGISWADTFSIYQDHLYFTNSRLHEVKDDISNMVFTLNRTRLAGQ